MRIISNLGIKFNIIEDNFNIYENGIKYLPKRYPLTRTRNSTTVLVEPHQNLKINKIPIARPILLWGPGLQNMIF